MPDAKRSAMFNRFRGFVFRALRLPPEPEPPAGAPDSVRVFRAARNYFRFRLFGWFLTQVGTLVGIIFSLGLLRTLSDEIDGVSHPFVPAPGVEIYPENRGPDVIPRPVAAMAERTPGWVIPVMTIVEVVGILGYLAQIPITLAAVRLDYELRWYMVTDRSLRIRSGIWKLRETTMSFANLQQVVVSQGPLQRLLSIADVRVQSAGGGGGSGNEQMKKDDSLHSGVFHGVDNAQEIRDLILRRLSRFREAGLGDPDDRHQQSESPFASEELQTAALQLLEEARRLRGAIVP